MSTATKATKADITQIEQRLHGVRIGAIRALLTLATFPTSEISSTELTEKMNQHRSTTTSQLGELTNLGVLIRTIDHTTENRANPTYLYTVNPEVNLVEVAELFFDSLPESQTFLATVQAKAEREQPPLPPLQSLPRHEVTIEFDSQLAQLVTALTRKVVELNERVAELELRPSSPEYVLPPDLTEAFKLLGQ